MDKYAIIVAGGSGTRMGASMPKQFLLLHGKPLFIHTVTAFLEAYADLMVVLVLPEAYLDQGKKIMHDTGLPDRYVITTGGETRFHSVKNGLHHVSGNSICFVHDAVRCLVSMLLIRRCYEAALEQGNAIPAIAATDSLRLETGSGTSQLLDRSRIRMIQTPQTFSGNILKEAFKQPYHSSFTDEASVVERTGVNINLIEGEKTNLKITTPLDLLIAGHILQQAL